LSQVVPYVDTNELQGGILMDDRKARIRSHKSSGVHSGGHARKSIATGFDCEPLPDGNVLLEFFGDDGVTFNVQVVTASVVESMRLVAILTGVAMREGVEAARRIFTNLSEDQDEEVSNDT
jgi:hypothetical protein